MNNESYRNEDARFSSSEQGKKAIKSFKQQLRVANRTDQTVRNYTRSIEGLMNFHNELPVNLELDQQDLKIEKERN
jgi:hypothetical protein